MNKYSVIKIREASISYRIIDEIKLPSDPLTTPESVFDYCQKFINQDPYRERVFIIALNTKLKIKGYYLLSIGSINETIVSIRDIFYYLILEHAHSFIMVHNHPSGNSEPSPNDIQITKEIMSAAKIMKISLIDHLIIGNDTENFFSFKKADLI